MGGIHPTIAPLSTLEHPLVDIIVRGDGHQTFEKLLFALEKKTKLESIENLGFKRNGKVILTKIKKNSLVCKGLLNYNLIKIEKYQPFTIQGYKATSLVSSIGCPYNCSYCYNSNKTFRNWQGFEPEFVLNQIRYFYKRGYNFFYFLDDNFFVDINRAEKIFDMIIDSGMKIKWAIQGVSVRDILRFKLSTFMKMMKSGCYSIEIGIDSFSEKTLKLINKQITLNDNLTVLKKLRKVKIIKKLNLVIGFPTQTKKEIKQDLNIARKVMDKDKLTYFLICPFTPFLGTEMFDLSLKKGYIEPKNLKEWSNVYFGNVDPNRKWISIKDQRWLRNAMFLFPFYNASPQIKLKSNLEKFLFSVYRPIARFRIKHSLYRFVPEFQMTKLLK